MRFGDIVRNGYASNGNPHKLTMFIRRAGKSAEMVALDGRPVKHCRDNDRLSVAMSCYTPDLFIKWAAMAKEIAATPDAPPATACTGCANCGLTCGACEDRDPDGTTCEKCGRVQHVKAICDGSGKVPVPHD